MFEIELSTSTIKEALKLVSPIVPSSPAHPILIGVKMVATDSCLKLTATNLTNWIHLTIPCLITSPGEIIVPLREFSKLVDHINTDFIKLTEFLTNDIDKDDRSLTISNTSGSQKAQLKLFEVGAFPAEKTKETKELTLTLPSQTIREAISRVVCCASQDDTKQVLTGVEFKFCQHGLTLTATDGHRMAMSEITLDSSYSEKSYVIPVSFLSKVLKLTKDAEEINITFYETSIEFNYLSQVNKEESNFSLSSLVLVGTYPNAKKLVPLDFETVFLVNREQFLNAITFVSIAAMNAEKHGEYLCALSVTNTYLNIEKNNTSVLDISQTVPGELIKGNEIQLGINFKYAKEQLASLKSETVEIRINTPTSPVIISTPSDEYNSIQLLMPMMLAK